jgi:cytochrome oxidase Cu insertion factor (SCO1/SenC/PrrC family)
MRARAIVLPLLTAALAGLLALALISGWFSGSSGSAPPAAQSSSTSGFDGAALPPGPPAPNFTLMDQDGRAVSLKSVRGHVSILAFLYSDCGPTCIVIAQQIRGALDELPEPVPVLIVSASPQGDTPASVQRFLARVSLTGRVHYLTGSTAALEPIWRAYGITPASSGSAAFDRFASVFLLDRSGARRVLFQIEQLTPEALSHDIRKLS